MSCKISWVWIFLLCRISVYPFHLWCSLNHLLLVCLCSFSIPILKWNFLLSLEIFWKKILVFPCLFQYLDRCCDAVSCLLSSVKFLLCFFLQSLCSLASVPLFFLAISTRACATQFAFIFFLIFGSVFLHLSLSSYLI